MEALAMAPLDWLEERSGLVGATKYFLFRKVPAESNWFHTLGSATLTAFLVQLVTGVILAMYYKPSPEEAYGSIQRITNDLTLGWLVRGTHRWGASVFIILLFLHMGRVFLFGAYKYPRELNWLVGVGLLVFTLGLGYTGYLLPWSQLSYWAGTIGLKMALATPPPAMGQWAAGLVFGGSTLGQHTVVRMYILHVFILPIITYATVGLHIFLVWIQGIAEPH
jgi:quinol-cytochrome oxidoreductase complex cytochrome b subunit